MDLEARPRKRSVAHSVQTGARVKLSAFNVYVPNFPDPDTTLIYNTFSGGFVSLDAATLEALKKADRGAELDEEEADLVDEDFFEDSVGIMVHSRSAEER